MLFLSFKTTRHCRIIMYNEELISTPNQVLPCKVIPTAKDDTVRKFELQPGGGGGVTSIGGRQGCAI